MSTLQPDRSVRLFHLLTALLAIFAASSCGGALFKVKPVVDLPPLPASSKSESVGGVTLRLAPLLSDEESQDLFEANLPVAGLLPLRMELVYEGGVPLEIKKARLLLRDSAGRQWKLLNAKQAASRILKANGIYAYNPSSRKQFEKELTSYEIDLKTPITSADSHRQGFLFFQTPDKQPVESPQGLTLSVDRVPQPIEIRVN